METLRAILSSPHVVDVALVVLLVEGVALLVWARRRRGITASDLAPQLGAGALLLLALRVALADGDPLWLGFFLAAALPANVWDVARRVQRAGADETST